MYNNKTNDRKLIEGNNDNPPSYLLNGVVSSNSGKTSTQSKKQLNDINS